MAGSPGQLRRSASTPRRSGGDRVASARRALLEGVGARDRARRSRDHALGGQVVAALYLSDGPRSMDELSAELGRSKSNIFANLRGARGGGHHRAPPRRRRATTRYTLRGTVSRRRDRRILSRCGAVVHDKQQLCQRALSLLADARGTEADSPRARLSSSRAKYAITPQAYIAVLPAIEGPVDLEGFLEALPPDVIARGRRGTQALGGGAALHHAAQGVAERIGQRAAQSASYEAHTAMLGRSAAYRAPRSGLSLC